MALDVFIISPIFSIGKSDRRGVGEALKSLRYPISSAEFAVDLLLESKTQTRSDQCRLFRAADPEFRCRGWRGRATESWVNITIFTKVVFIHYSPWPPVKITLWWLPPTVDMVTKTWTVRRVSRTISAHVSTDVNKLVQHTTSIYIRHSEKVVFSEWRANVIAKVDFIGQEITCGTPVRGNIPDGLHTGLWKAVTVPFRRVFVGWNVVQIECFSIEEVLVLQRVGLDQSPCKTWLWMKVAINWEGVVELVHDVENSIWRCFVKNHDFLAWSRR